MREVIASGKVVLQDGQVSRGSNMSVYGQIMITSARLVLHQMRQNAQTKLSTWDVNLI